MDSLVPKLSMIFSEEGKISSLPNFEFRSQQLEMALAVGDALLHKHHLIVEAPTGVGKSLAYLIPALMVAKLEKRKAIISTHTKNLQEQLLKKDLAIVRALLDEPFDAVVFKGRGNYLCTTRLQHALRQQRQLFDKEELEQLSRIKEWSMNTPDGDVEGLPSSPSSNVWKQVCSEKGACSSTTCRGSCFFQKARSRAREADLVIMNHALFFTLFAMQGSDEFFLYKNDFVIFDEAHTLEQIAGIGVGKSISRLQVLFAIHRLFNPKTKKGLLSRSKHTRCRGLCETTEHAAEKFFSDIVQAVSSLAERANTLRIRTPYFVNDTITRHLHDLQSGIREVEDDEKSAQNKEELTAVRRLVWEAETLIHEFLAQPDRSLTYWVELHRGRGMNVFLHTAPTIVADSVAPKLFKKGTSVIMTSATLATNDSLHYFQQRLGAGSAKTLLLDSPFDFRRQMRLVLAKGIPPPDDPGYEIELPDWIYRSVARSRGKALVLFTSSSLMRRVAVTLRERIESDGIMLLVQDGTTQRHRLLEQFRKDVHSVLFGLDSFWMGVDVPGEALENVIITRLPFAVPDHPLIEARIEVIAERGGNSFLEFTLPEAVLKFKQGVGRLIRSTTDKGEATILDSRIMTKQYGRIFIESLPKCPIEIMQSDGSLVRAEME